MKIRQTLVSVFLCACAMATAQAPPAAILQIATENQVRYAYDTSDLSAFATVQAPITQVFPTFATWPAVSAGHNRSGEFSG